MKKVLALLTALCLVLCVAACGAEPPVQSDEVPMNGSQEQVNGEAQAPAGGESGGSDSVTPDCL